MMGKVLLLMLVGSITIQASPVEADDGNKFDHIKAKLLTLATELADEKTKVCGLELKMQERLQDMNQTLTTILKDLDKSLQMTEMHGQQQGQLRQDLDSVIHRLNNVSSTSDVHKYVCPERWVHYERYCFFFATTAVTWTVAKQRCLDRDAYLAVIDTAEINEFIKQRLRQPEGNMHLVGGFDFGYESQWRWDRDSSDVDFADWNVNQPNGDDRQDCLTVCMGDTCQWNDVECTYETSYICQKLAEISTS